MTVVAYYRDALYADRMCVMNQHRNLERYELVPKIRVTPCRRVAYGLTGMMFHKDDLHIIDRMIVGMMMQVEQDGKHRPFEESKPIQDVFKPGQRAWFIMTSRVTWTVGFQGEESKQHGPDELMASGTGAVTWQALANPAGEPYVPLEQIVPTISRVIDTVSFESDVIYRRDLVPFRFVKEKK